MWRLSHTVSIPESATQVARSTYGENAAPEILSEFGFIDAEAFGFAICPPSITGECRSSNKGVVEIFAYSFETSKGASQYFRGDEPAKPGNLTGVPEGRLVGSAETTCPATACATAQFGYRVGKSVILGSATCGFATAQDCESLMGSIGSSLYRAMKE